MTDSAHSERSSEKSPCGKIIHIHTDKNLPIPDRNKNVTGRIWIQCGAQHFPAADWTDFPIILLSWWSTAFIDILNGHPAKARWKFMDGPFCATLQTLSDTQIQVTFMDDRGGRASQVGHYTIDTRQLATSLLAAINKIGVSAIPAHLQSDEIRSIVRSIPIIKRFISAAQ